MKTPERWRPSRVVPSLSVFLPKSPPNSHSICMTSRHVWHHDVTTWRHMTEQVIPNWMCTGQLIWNFKNRVFQSSDLDLWPMSLTLELIRDIVNVDLSKKFWVRMSHGSPVRALTNRQTHTQMHTQTHRTGFIPSTADAGGEKALNWPQALLAMTNVHVLTG